MIVNVVIVDDDKENASDIKEAVLSYESKLPSNLVVYKVTKIFTEIHAFSSARQYIISFPNEIDILMVDYHLIRGLGTDLFKVIDRNYKLYKVLHSETSKSLNNAQNEFAKTFDVFCDSKDVASIHAVLQRFENEILSIKYYGNPRFRSLYYLPSERPNNKANEKFFNTRLLDILYIKTVGNSSDRIYFCYRSHDDEIVCDTKSRYSLNYFSKSNLLYRRAAGYLMLNLLWISRIDLIANKAEFIVMSSKVFEIDLPCTSVFDKEIKPYLRDIESLPHFFRL